MNSTIQLTLFLTTRVCLGFLTLRLMLISRAFSIYQLRTSKASGLPLQLVSRFRVRPMFEQMFLSRMIEVANNSPKTGDCGSWMKSDFIRQTRCGKDSNLIDRTSGLMLIGYSTSTRTTLCESSKVKDVLVT